ncbi:MAG TPA: hypothetical protein VF050_04760 [Moraxellaceae bacterium]
MAEHRRRRSRRESEVVLRPLDWRWLLLAGFGLVFLLWALAWGVADVAAYRARVWTETWANQDQLALRRGLLYVPAEKDWQEALSAAELAQKLAPRAADYEDLLAHVYASRHIGAADGDAQAMPYWQQAEVHYRRAIALRPTWPYSYVALAQVQRRMHRLDRDYEHNLRQALHYGPWEPAIHMAIVDMNLDLLAQLQPSTRQLVLDTLRRGQAWTTDSKGGAVPYGDRLWARVVQRHKQFVVCGWLSQDDLQLRARCNPALAPG